VAAAVGDGEWSGGSVQLAVSSLQLVKALVVNDETLKRIKPNIRPIS